MSLVASGSGVLGSLGRSLVSEFGPDIIDWGVDKYYETKDKIFGDMKRKARSNAGAKDKSGRAYKKRRRNYQGKDYQASTGGGGVLRFGFKRKRRLGRKAYRRKLYNASSEQFKHRSDNTFTASNNTGTLIENMTVDIKPFICDSAIDPFWTPLGGLVQRHFDSVLTDFGQQDLFVRGGLSTIVWYNGGTQPVHLTSWKMRTRPDANLMLFPSTVLKSWDPSLPTQTAVPTADGSSEDPWRQYKLWGCEAVILKPGESFMRTARIRSGKLSVRAHNQRDNRQYWMYSLYDQQNAVTETISIVHTHNLSFTGDRTQ